MHPAPHYHYPYVKFHGRYYPLIPLTLSHGQYAVNTFALLDSGASMSVFRPEIARALRIPLKGKQNIQLGTANGGVTIAVTKVDIEIEETKFSTPIGFSSTYATSFNIIGREGFFHRFSIVFNELMKTVILMPVRRKS
jgi:predicted aspartyl protease